MRKCGRRHEVKGCRVATSAHDVSFPWSLLASASVSIGFCFEASASPFVFVSFAVVIYFALLLARQTCVCGQCPLDTTHTRTHARVEIKVCVSRHGLRKGACAPDTRVCVVERRALHTYVHATCGRLAVCASTHVRHWQGQTHTHAHIGAHPNPASQGQRAHDRANAPASW